MSEKRPLPWTLIILLLIVAGIAARFFLSDRPTTPPPGATQTTAYTYGGYGYGYGYGATTPGGYGYGGHGSGYGNAPKTPPTCNLNKEFLARQLAWEKETGTQNSITLYAQLDDPIPFDAPSDVEDILKNTISGGWTEKSELLVPLFEHNEANFKLIRDAAKIGNNLQFSVTRLQDPVMDFTVIQVTAKIMCAHALWNDLQGDHDRAAADAAALLHMGHAQQNKNTMLLGYLIGIATESMACDTAMRILQSGTDRAKNLTALYTTCARRDEKTVNALNALIVEQSNMQSIQEEMEDQAHGATARVIVQKQMEPFRDFIELLHEMEVLELRELLTKSNPAVDHYKKELADIEDSPMFFVAPDIFETAAREGTAKAKTGLVGTAALILGSTVGGVDNLLDTAPGKFLDPFSGEPFLFDAGAAKPFELRSVGPDLMPEPAYLPYDPTNGTFSAGDIYFGKHE